MRSSAMIPPPGSFQTAGSDRSNRNWVFARLNSLFETGDYSLWLADLRYLNRSFQEFGPWIAQEIIPRVLAAALKREAVVLPQYRGAPGTYDVFGAASDTREKLPRADFLKFFEEIDPAMAWLATPDA